MIKKTMELVWHDCKTCPPAEEYNERLFILSGLHVVPVVWKNGKFYYSDGPLKGSVIDISYPCVYWADIDQTTTKFFNRAVATQKKWHYCVNTVSKNDNPVQLEGDIEAESEDGVIQKLIDNGVICPRSYEFLELVQTSDWLTSGLSEQQLAKEKEKSLRWRVKVICPKCGARMLYKNWFSWVWHNPFHWFGKRRTQCSNCYEYSWMKRERSNKN